MSATVPCYNPSHGVKFHQVGTEAARDCARTAARPGPALLAALPPATSHTVRYGTVQEARRAHARAMSAKEDAELVEYAEAVGAASVEDLSDGQRSEAINRIDDDEWDDISAGIAVGLPEHLRAEFLADTGLGIEYHLQPTDIPEGRTDPLRVGDRIATHGDLLDLPFGAVAMASDGTSYRITDDLGGKEVQQVSIGGNVRTTAGEVLEANRDRVFPEEHRVTLAWLPPRAQADTETAARPRVGDSLASPRALYELPPMSLAVDPTGTSYRVIEDGHGGVLVHLTMPDGTPRMQQNSGFPDEWLQRRVERLAAEGGLSVAWLPEEK